MYMYIHNVMYVYKENLSRSRTGRPPHHHHTYTHMKMTSKARTKKFTWRVELRSFDRIRNFFLGCLVLLCLKCYMYGILKFFERKKEEKKSPPAQRAEKERGGEKRRGLIEYYWRERRMIKKRDFSLGWGKVIYI